MSQHKKCVKQKLLDELKAGTSKAILKKQKANKNRKNSSSNAKKNETNSRGKLLKITGKGNLKNICIATIAINKPRLNL